MASLYTTVIERGNTLVNDRVIDFLKPRIQAPYLDIGCNAGWLLSEVAGGIGLEASAPLAARAQARGLNVVIGRAESLPFDRCRFKTAVLSCILEQCQRWPLAFAEAIRIARRVVGVNPYPGRSSWGTVGGWVRSLIPPEELEALGAIILPVDEARYYFEFA